MQDVPMRKYLLHFALAYLAALGALIIVSLFINLSGGSLGTAVFVVAVGYAAHRFARDHGRVPTQAERRKFALSSTLVSVAVSLLLLGVLFLVPGAAAEMGAMGKMLARAGGAFLVSMLVISGIYFAAAYFLFRWIAGSTLKQAARKKKGTEPGDGKQEPQF